MIYVLSVSLQVAGALMLMINSLSTKRAKVIQRFAGHTLIWRDNNTNEISYDEEVFKDTYKEAYLSKFAFLYIAMGYFMGIFAIIDVESKVMIAVGVVILTIAFIVLAYLVVRLILKYNKKITCKITNEELEELGIEPDIENISNDEIEKMWNEALNK